MTSASRHRRRNVAAPAHFALYGELPGESEVELIHIEDIPSRARLYDWTIKPHSHREMWQFIYVANGVAEASIEDLRINLRPRSVLCVPDGVVHGFAFQPDTPGWVLSIETRLFETAACAPLRRLLAQRRREAARIDLTPEENRDIRSLFSQIHREFIDAREGRGLMLDSLTNALLVLILRNAPEKPAGDASTPDGERVAAAFRALVNRHFREHWDIARYADAISVSQSQLSRSIRRATGHPPKAMISARLLLEAQRNLRYTEATAAQIALDLGFRDPAYFSRFFRRLTGLTPRRYRTITSEPAAEPSKKATL